METPEPCSERWLKPSEVARLFVEADLFKVPLSTLRSWASSGKITSARTVGGHRRYRESDVRALVAELSQVAV